MRRAFAISLLGIAAWLAGCDQLGIETPAAVATRREADGKAVGAACRHAGRPIEDCYTLNRKVDRAAIFAGWREMNDYMRENKLESLPSQLKPEPQVAANPDAESEDEAPAKGGDKAKKPKGATS